MDNSKFRDLLQHDQRTSSPGGAVTRQDFKKPALGSRARASISMTPRSIGGQNASKIFTRRAADHREGHGDQPAVKKLKSSAPKGTKFASGYQDRTQARQAAEDGVHSGDDKEKRLKALEEMYKLQQIDEPTFEGLKGEIGVGGDLGSTHLVKGLDWKLLERIRQGDDINSTPQPQKKPGEPPNVDVEDELDHVLEKDVEAVSRTQRKAQDETTAEEQPITRNEILRRLKESRSGTLDTVTPSTPVLGDRFKKVKSSPSNKKKYVEVVNGRRREVLVITNKDGTTKRKTRWLDKDGDVRKDAQSPPLGMEVPVDFLAKQQALLEEQARENEDDDIFQGVTDYNPLAGINSGSEDEGDNEPETGARVEMSVASPSLKPRNYFAASNGAEEPKDRINPIMKDPTLISALKRAAALGRSEGSADDDPNLERASKHQQLLARLKKHDQEDAADVDLGFGESRFGDEDEEDGAIREDGEGTEKKSGRKRGPKKRKGDKHNVSDVVAVMQGRQNKS